jgi:hypothetical protein
VIARIATFAMLPPDVSAEVRRNVLERFMTAIRAQDGFVAGYWLANGDGTWISFTVWQSEWAMERGGERANATPLLPAQDPNKIPSPTTVQSFPVVADACKGLVSAAEIAVLKPFRWFRLRNEWRAYCSSEPLASRPLSAAPVIVGAITRRLLRPATGERSN